MKKVRLKITCLKPSFLPLVNISGVAVPGYTFSAADTVSDDVATTLTDGYVHPFSEKVYLYPQIFTQFDGISIFGMGARGSLASQPFVQVAFEEGLIPNNEFSVKLTDTDPSIYIGGVDKSAIIGDVEYHPTSIDSSEPISWSLGNATI